MSEETTDVTRDITVAAEGVTDVRAQAFQTVTGVRLKNNGPTMVVLESRLEAKNTLSKQRMHLDHLLDPHPGSELIGDMVVLEPGAEVWGTMVFRFMQPERAGLDLYIYPQSQLEYRLFVREFGEPEKYIRTEPIRKVVA